MSYLLIRGKTLICTNCDFTLPIEYEGGAQATQIGDLNVWEQREINKKHMPADYNPDKYGYYFFVEAICGDCLQARLDDKTVAYDKNTSPPFDDVEHIVYRLSEAIEEDLEKAAAKYAKLFNADYCRQLAPEVYEKTIGQKYFKLTNKKWTLAEQYIDQAKNNIIEDFKKYLAASEVMKEYVEVYQEVYAEYEAELKELMEGGKTKYYQQLDLTGAENLNPYICYDQTVRTQIKPDNDYAIYEGPYSIPRKAVRIYLSSGPFDQLVKPGSDVTEGLLGRLKKRIVGFLPRGEADEQQKN